MRCNIVSNLKTAKIAPFLRRAVFLGAVILAFGLNSAKAALIVDQSFEGPGNVAYSFSSSGQLAQSFTVGTPGLLVRIDVLQQCSVIPAATGNLLFDVRKVTGGIPQWDDSPVLASGSIPISTLPVTGWYSISGLAIPVTVGEQLAVVLKHDQDSFGVAWQALEYQDLYLGGKAFGRNIPSDIWYPQSGDFLFKTYVGSQSVPEPTTLIIWSLLGGLAIAYGWRRKRRLA